MKIFRFPLFFSGIALGVGMLSAVHYASEEPEEKHFAVYTAKCPPVASSEANFSLFSPVPVACQNIPLERAGFSEGTVLDTRTASLECIERMKAAGFLPNECDPVLEKLLEEQVVWKRTHGRKTWEEYERYFLNKI